MTGPLDGIRVIDFTQMMQGGWAIQKLGDLGADVVKIEPVGGEYEREEAVNGRYLDGVSPWFLAMNRNKRSLPLDLKSDEGLAIAEDLVSEADVVAENFRPGVMEGLGLGYEAVQEINPEVVYVSASGWGSDGPYSDRPGQDLLAQATSGLPTITGRRSDPPTNAGTFIADQLSATGIALYTVAALLHRERTGEGQLVETNLLNALLDGITQEITAALNMDLEYERSEAGVAHAALGAPYGYYETADGYVAISLAPVPDLADIFDDDALREYETPSDWFEHRDDIKRRIESHTREFETEALLDRLVEADVWAAEVLDFQEMAEDPQVRHNDMIVELEHPKVGRYETTGIPVDMSETPGELRTSAPLLGEHTDAVLSELGYDDDTIDRLVDDGVTKRAEE
jgi:crotonobetainyl-CoA:carnitine CoA-transferase CaiB-like acyl-CoA transferase